MAEIRQHGERKPFFRQPLVRAAVAVVVVALVALAVLSVVDLPGPGGLSIVEEAIAALDPTENAIIHVKVSGTESSGDGYEATWTEESWTLTESPHTCRSILAFAGAPVMEIVQDSDGLTGSYDAVTNTIYQPPRGEGFETVPVQPDPYRRGILELLNSGEAVVEGSDSIDGREVTRIAFTGDFGTAADGTTYGTWYYVDPGTKNPVAWRMTRNTHDGGKTVTLHFDLYEQLPADEANLKLLDLAAQYPEAVVSISLQSFKYSGGWPGWPLPELSGDPADKKAEEE